ncbi:DUF732 domain-containing protein [Mycolicibacterium goodii]|uniref:Membrane protein n=1 Tax=Mycolicibacterium goodii TaxID=134601 RepID=A0A0K0X3A7_MYCGD|nr:membrane protein [Mycolicibacterium goodii]
MVGFRFHPDLIRRAAYALVAAAVGYVAAAVAAPDARADEFVYLVNVTVRPGYNFASPDAALAYGRGICSKVAAGTAYGRLVGDVRGDFHTSDEFHASYLVSQAVNELCPEMIWQLRNSAAGYRSGEV